MQVSADQGALLTLADAARAATFAVEVGTFTGYSSICIARGLQPGGRLLCCDVSEEYTAIARRAWAQAGLADRIELRIGPGHRDAAGAAGRDDDRRRLHRRRQAELRQLLRRAAAPPARRRADPGRQHAVVGPRRRPRRPTTTPTSRRSAASTTRSPPTTGSTATSSPSADGLTLIASCDTATQCRAPSKREAPTVPSLH